MPPALVKAAEPEMHTCFQAAAACFASRVAQLFAGFEYGRDLNPGSFSQVQRQCAPAGVQVEQPLARFATSVWTRSGSSRVSTSHSPRT